MARRYTRRTTRRKRAAVPRKKSRAVSRRSRTTRRRTSAKRILNVSSTKKHDTIAGSSETKADLSFYDFGGSFVPFPQVQGITGATVSVWCPTYRFLGSSPQKYDHRSASTVYYRGVREQVQFYLRNASPVVWRRCVVGSNLNVANTASYSLNDTNLYGRTQLYSESTYIAFFEVLTQGTRNSDYTSNITAKLDEKKCKIYYDKTRVLRPKTTTGDIQTYKMWHPINKTIQYDEEEKGSDISSSPWASNEPPNHNVYIIDLFQSINTTTTNQVSWNVETTSYWHER